MAPTPETLKKKAARVKRKENKILDALMRNKRNVLRQCNAAQAAVRVLLEKTPSKEYCNQIWGQLLS